MLKILDFFNTFIFGQALPIVIFLVGGFLIFKYCIPMIKKPSAVLRVLMRKNENEGISPLKTAILALASTLGVGNIVGVSTAIYMGGAGAVFWLTVSAFMAMPLKYGEVVLAMKYRTKIQGEYRGGAMYYMRDGLKNKTLSAIFAVLCTVNSFTVGNIVQINALSECVTNIFEIKPIYVGMFLAVIILYSISRKTSGISDITSKIIPLATAAYTLLSGYIIVKNYDKIWSVIRLVMNEAFSLKSLTAGLVGYAITRAIRYGVARGIMSNEAGCGTSPISHAKSNLTSPTEQGFWGIFEVFADTVIMCNLTAFVILFSYNDGVIERGLSGMELVLYSYTKYAGKSASIIIVLCVFFFAYATVICQGFYGKECVFYLTKNKRNLALYTLIYSAFAIVGTKITGALLWALTDFNISLMTIVNTACVLYLSGEIKKETEGYFLEIK